MRILKLLLPVATAASLLTACSNGTTQTASYAVIPLPESVTLQDDAQAFLLDKKVVIACEPGEGLNDNAIYLKENLSKLTGLDLKIAEGTPTANAIVLKTVDNGENPEGYTMTVDKDLITITGNSAAGNFYGINTLIKAIPDAEKGNVVFPAVTITDEPRFGYRGAHFDVARHFFPADSVKEFIDMIALHNINRFHWHLTDDQGWRIEIKSRPLLTEIGSKRSGTVIGHNSGEYDSIPVEGFYTQEEIKDIVDYAAKRHITVIPEIDLPGHMQAALCAYPYMGCTGKDYEVWQMWGVSENVLCAGNDSIYALLDDVLGEVADLFPGELVHIGGDECPKSRWEECVVCQAKIAELGLKTDKVSTKEDKLQSYVMQHATDFLAGKGKRVIGWDEILEGGASDDAIIMSWRGVDGAIQAARLGHDAIMTPTDYLYFDYYQTLDREGEPDAIGGYVPVEKVYGFEPVPAELTPEEAAHILGLQANLWTEYISTFDYAQYMELPRMAALSEVQWSSAPKDYDNFVKRLPQLINHYRANGYRYSTHVYDIQGQSEPVADAKTISYTLKTAGDGPVYYTLDGSEPDTNSAVYSEPLSLDKHTVIKAKTYLGGEPSKTFIDSVTINKATWKPIRLETSAAPNYAQGGAEILVDGCYGPNAVEKGKWLGFNAEDCIVVIDLQQPEEISSVTATALAVTGAWICDMRAMKVEVSSDDKTWSQVAGAEYDPLPRHTNKIISHTVNFDPVTAQYVRVSVMTEKAMPEWHEAAGKPAFVFLDEIAVN